MAVSHLPAAAIRIAYWLIALGLLWWFVMQPAPVRSLTPAAAQGNIVAIGELVAGREVRQELWFPSAVAEQPFTLVVHLAAYARPNTGCLQFVISQGTRRYAHTVAMANVRDGEPLQLLMPEPSWQPGRALLVVTGIDGVPGSSVTAWATTDFMGPAATTAGLDTDLQLLVNYHTRGSMGARAELALGSLWWVGLFFLAILVGGDVLLSAALTNRSDEHGQGESICG